MSVVRQTVAVPEYVRNVMEGGKKADADNSINLSRFLKIPLLDYRTLWLWCWSDIASGFLEQFFLFFLFTCNIQSPLLLFTHAFLWWAVMCIKSNRFTLDINLSSLQLFKKVFRVFSFLRHWVLNCVWFGRDRGLSLLITAVSFGTPLLPFLLSLRQTFTSWVLNEQKDWIRRYSIMYQISSN